jgi:hypothetical protein
MSYRISSLRKIRLPENFHSFLSPHRSICYRSVLVSRLPIHQLLVSLLTPFACMPRLTTPQLLGLDLLQLPTGSAQFISGQCRLRLQHL